MISRTTAYKEKGILLNFYKTLVRPNLEHCMCQGERIIGEGTGEIHKNV